MQTTAYECYKLSNGTYVIRVYAITFITAGNVSIPAGRTLTDERAYISQNAMVIDLRLLVG